jgi:adenylosuccinate lyase
MIERYSRPQMKKIWSEENKFDKWLQVEIAVCEAWSEVGTIPKEAIPKIKQPAATSTVSPKSLK